MVKWILYSCVLLIAVSSCSVQKYLPEGERLYRGATIKIKKQKGVGSTTGNLHRNLELAVRPKGNKFFLGQPYKVWWWYKLYKTKSDRGLKAYLKTHLGAPPILSSAVNAKVTAVNMQAFMENLGYFHTIVTGDTVNEKYFTRAIYKANVYPRYKIRNITWVNDSSAIMKELQAAQGKGILKAGNHYQLSDLQAENDRLDGVVKTKGYYYFNPKYIMAYVDSTVGENKVDIYLSLKQTTPANARQAFTINKITVFPNYTLLLPPPDTARLDATKVEGLMLRDTLHRFKASMFTSIISYRPGELYSSREQNTTLNRFINLGSFKFVKNRFEQVKDTGNPYKLNAFYYLTPRKKNAFQAELDAFSKENKYIGSQVGLTWRNRNAFKGSELLLFKMYGGIEVSFADSISKNNVYRYGAEVSLNFPRYIVPFIKISDHNLYAPRTRFLLGYEVFQKQLMYTKNVYRLQYELNWRPTSNKEHSILPITITYINSFNLTDTFRKQVAINPGVMANVYNEILLGSFYSFTYNTANPFAKRQWFFVGSIDIAGNAAGLATGAKQPRSKEVFGTPFAQYAKADIDFRYLFRIGKKIDFANRFQIGAGFPYNNSNVLPFTKQYVIGGGNSMRGFALRKLGPGSYLPTYRDQQYFQIIGGDYRLQINSELRFPLMGKFSGAAFVDIGNIWTKDTFLFGRAGQLKKDFYKELAMATGLGLRFDAGIILLRADIGIPIRKPYLPEKERWVFDKINFGSSDWRRDNFTINLALGYPF